MPKEYTNMSTADQKRDNYLDQLHNKNNAKHSAETGTEKYLLPSHAPRNI